MSCPHCDSADVRPSRHTRGLDRIGLHRYRCRACGGLFWLRRGRIEAVRARRREYLETPAGTAPDRGPAGDSAAARPPSAGSTSRRTPRLPPRTCGPSTSSSPAGAAKPSSAEGSVGGFGLGEAGDQDLDRRHEAGRVELQPVAHPCAPSPRRPGARRGSARTPTRTPRPRPRARWRGAARGRGRGRVRGEAQLDEAEGPRRLAQAPPPLVQRRDLAKVVVQPEQQVVPGRPHEARQLRDRAQHHALKMGAWAGAASVKLRHARVASPGAGPCHTRATPCHPEGPGVIPRAPVPRCHPEGPGAPVSSRGTSIGSGPEGSAGGRPPGGFFLARPDRSSSE